MPKDQIFYVGQKALIERDGKILVLQREPFGADLPGGKIQVGELDSGCALQREVFEETGLQIHVGAPFATGFFRFPEHVLTSRNLQTGYIYIVIYRVDNLEGEIVLSDEHQSYSWVSEAKIETIKDDNRFIKRVLRDYFEAKKVIEKP